MVLTRRYPMHLLDICSVYRDLENGGHAPCSPVPQRPQSVRIPRDMELDADEAILRREGDRLILEPVLATPLLALLATLKPIDDEFPDIDASLPPPRYARL